MDKRIILAAAVALLALAGCRPAEKAVAKELPDGGIEFENNLIAGRFTASGLDVLVKEKDGKAKDVYDADNSLGGGASAPFINGKLCFPTGGCNSGSIEHHGPDTVVFTLLYPEWEAAEGIRVSLKKTVTVVADSYFCDVEDVYHFSGAPALVIAAGFTRHQALGTIEVEHNMTDRLSIWEAASDQAEQDGGSLGIAAIMPDAQMRIFPTDRSHSLLIKAVESDDPVSYKIGSCWSKGDIKTAETWFKKVDNQ